jgi:hypothetical protein
MEARWRGRLSLLSESFKAAGPTNGRHAEVANVCWFSFLRKVLVLA